MVDVHPERTEDVLPRGTVGLQVGLGHPTRAVVWFCDPSGADFGFEDDVDDQAEPITFDLGGTSTEYTADQTRVRPTTARHAALEFLRTGQRPTCLQWPRWPAPQTARCRFTAISPTSAPAVQ